MPRVNKNMLSQNSNSKTLTIIFIILAVVLLIIILFVIFYPKKQYVISVQRGQEMQPYPLMVPESFDNYGPLMENMSNAEPNLNSSDPTIVFFFAPWCGHCKNAKPEFEKLMNMLKDKTKAIMVNCDENQEVARDFNIEGYPTIRFYPNGPKNKDNAKEYQGPRTAEDMLQFVSQ